MVDADLSGYFDGIPHAELMKSVSRRIGDGRIPTAREDVAETPVEETTMHGIPPSGRPGTRTRGWERRRCPDLLSNIYMRRFVKGWKTGGHEKRLAAKIVNYADDFVICCRGTADEAADRDAGMMSKLES